MKFLLSNVTTQRGCNCDILRNFGMHAASKENPANTPRSLYQKPMQGRKTSQKIGAFT
jgi:hypothetical protein